METSRAAPAPAATAQSAHYSHTPPTTSATPQTVPKAQNFQNAEGNGKHSAHRARNSQSAPIAQSAPNAQSATNTRSAPNAQSATNTRSAPNAQSATNTRSAPNAQSATNTRSAPNAQSATNTRSAPNAQSATNTRSAPNAQSATNTRSAPNAQSATNSRSAPNAQSATNTRSAPNAQSATNTRSAPNAQSATNSRNALNAQSAPNVAGPANSPRRQKQTDNANNNNSKRANMVHVSGFPPYTQAVDLGRTFSKFGNVRVEKLNARMSFAVLAYTTDAEAKEAIQANKKVNIYGEFLNVRAHSQQNVKMTPKRDFTRSKQKGMIVEPSEIDLSGDFHQQLDSVLAAVRLTQEEALAVSVLYADLERVLQALWPGCVAMPFGSITTGLGIKTSDADCYMHVPPAYRPGHNFVNKAKRVLLSYPLIFSEILAIPRANTPIVKFFHIPTETNCDLSFKTPLGSQNSKLIAFLLHADPRLIPMAVLVKYWAKVHGLSGTGKLTNYALTMMIIFYLQQPPMMILPSVEWLQRDPQHEVMVDHWNTGFMNKKELLPPCSNTSSISELLGGFFEYYSRFNFQEMVVCPYLGTPVKKEAFVDITRIPKEYNRYKANTLTNLTPPLRVTTSMCVQDPFEQCHNVASAISSKLADDIKVYLKFAADTYEKEKLSGCKEFLKTILLQKPKIIRAKLHPEYRINLFHRVIGSIVDPDWKTVIREAVVTVFEKILKINLGDTEADPKSKKEKERYTATVTKAIWKRKQFTRLYSSVNLEFVQKQTRITEEVLAIEQETIDLQFSLTLMFRQDPKNRTAIVSIKLSNGDVDHFKEFGRFFLTIMHSWMSTLLKPHKKTSQPHTQDQTNEFIKQIDRNNTLDSDDDDDVEDNCNESVENENDTEGPENDISVDNDVSSTDEDAARVGGAVANDSGDNEGPAVIDENEEPKKKTPDHKTPADTTPDNAITAETTPDNTAPADATPKHKAPDKTAPATSTPDNTAPVETKQTRCDPVQPDNQTNS